VKRLSSCLFSSLLFVCSLGCGDKGTKELREFAQVEAAIGMVAGASTFERDIRLEQLEAIEVSSKRVTALQQMCATAYRSFNKAAALLESARQRTEAVEKQVKILTAQKAAGKELSKEEETRILEMSATAAESLKSVTKELDLAEERVAACQAKRGALRRELSNR
jgi:hypothetical protein